jgi:predicted metal-dependent HD superfamily phosphohydrolase
MIDTDRKDREQRNVASQEMILQRLSRTLPQISLKLRLMILSYCEADGLVLAGS